MRKIPKPLPVIDLRTSALSSYAENAVIAAILPPRCAPHVASIIRWMVTTLPPVSAAMARKLRSSSGNAWIKDVTGAGKDLTGAAKDVTGIRRDFVETKVSEKKLEEYDKQIQPATFEDVKRFDPKIGRLFKSVTIADSTMLVVWIVVAALLLLSALFIIDDFNP